MSLMILLAGAGAAIVLGIALVAVFWKGGDSSEQ